MTSRIWHQTRHSGASQRAEHGGKDGDVQKAIQRANERLKDLTASHMDIHEGVITQAKCTRGVTWISEVWDECLGVRSEVGFRRF